MLNAQSVRFFFFCCIFTVPRKRSRGTLVTAYTVLHGYIHLLHREDQARLSLTVKLHVLVWENPSFVLSRKPGDEATRAIAGAQAEVAGARAPVCPSLATPLMQRIIRRHWNTSKMP